MRVIQDLAQRIFRSSEHVEIEYVDIGYSTDIYRIRHCAQVFYLRVLPASGQSFAPEVDVLSRLRAQGARVPEVIYFEHVEASLGRSVMLTTEVPGTPLCQHDVDHHAARILTEAGRDLALINRITVNGFDWIRRDAQPDGTLFGRQAAYRSFILHDFDAHLAVLGDRVLEEREVDMIRAIVEYFDAALDIERSWLVHGDLDLRHIFQQDGRYTGIIDFSAIRGADVVYDLGHFRLHASPLLPYLLDGYREVAVLPADYEARIVLHSLLIGVRALGSSLKQWPDQDAINHPIAAAIRRDLAQLPG